jgi:predicted transposase YdaD
MEKEESVDAAVERCIAEGYLVDYLRQHIGEARGMLLSGFNQEIYEKGLREEGWEDGIRKGRQEGREAGIEEGTEKLVKNLLRNNTPEFVAEQCGLELEYVNSIKEKCEVCKSL